MSKHSNKTKHSPEHREQSAESPKRTVKKTPSGIDRKLYKVIGVLGVVVILLAAAVLVVYFHGRAAAREEYEVLQESVRHEPLPTVEVTLVPRVTEQPTEVSEEPAEPTPVPVEIPVDLPYLQSLNSDVIGWITVEGTDIDYPILYDKTDNPYYLDHTRTGKYSAAGSIFIQTINDADFSDFNTVVYGHNMKDGSMFAQLHRFEEKDFFDEHDTIVIYTNDRVLTYKIIAAYVRDNEHLMKYYTYATEGDRQAYIDHIYDQDGNFNYDIEVAPDDRIISLSTCTGWTYTRYIVQGVLVSEEAGVCITDE